MKTSLLLSILLAGAMLAADYPPNARSAPQRDLIRVEQINPSSVDYGNSLFIDPKSAGWLGNTADESVQQFRLGALVRVGWRGDQIYVVLDAARVGRNWVYIIVPRSKDEPLKFNGK